MDNTGTTFFDKIWNLLYFDRYAGGEVEHEMREVIGVIYNMSLLEEPDYDEMWNKVAPKKRRRAILRPVHYAAALIPLILGAACLFFFRNREVAVSYADDTVTLTLSDGSVIKLGTREWNDAQCSELSLIADKDDMGIAYVESGLAESVECAQTQYDVESMFHTLHIPATRDYRLTLADGTVVWLNSDTRLRYPAAFGDTERRVYLLEGEACFEVVKDEDRTFVVEVNGHEIEALGTLFDVNVYPELMGGVKTTLVEGCVRISNGVATAVLSPGQQAFGTADGLTVTDVDAGKFIAWIEGRFIFEEKPLKDIMIQIARWYGLDIQIMSPELEDFVLTGMIEKDNIPETTFELLEKVADVRFEITKEGIVMVAKR